MLAVLPGLPGEIQQRCLDAAADALRFAKLKLREDRVDVALDRALRDDDALRDGRVAPALRDEREDLLLAWRQRVEVGVRPPSLGRQQQLDDAGVHNRVAGRALPQRASEIASPVDALLEPVGASVRALLEELRGIQGHGV